MADGFHGFLDFAGYPVGQGILPRKPHAGLHGTVDWAGYPCGGGVQVPSGNVFAAGKRLARYLISEEMARAHRSAVMRDRLRELGTRLRREAENVMLMEAVEAHSQMVNLAVGTVLLAEV